MIRALLLSALFLSAVSASAETMKLAVKALLEVASVDDSGKNIEVAVMRAG